MRLLLELVLTGPFFIVNLEFLYKLCQESDVYIVQY